MFEIRVAGLEDIPSIREVAEKTWYVTYQSIMTKAQSDYMFDMMYSVDSLTAQISSGQVFFLAFEDVALCGYVSVEHEAEDLFHIHKIYVDPAMQGRGLGRRLIEQAFDFAKNKATGHCVVELNVNRDNKARFFYEKMGLVIDRQRDFPIGNGYYMYDYVMKRNLP
jgi:ribosomal protein S18 acetylase RimI-like enzyme